MGSTRPISVLSVRPVSPRIVCRDKVLTARYRNWTGGTGNIPLGLTPFETSLADSFSLVVECLDCRTFGDIVAEFNNDDGLKATLTFNNVGAYLDFGVFSSNEGTFTIGLGRFFGSGNVTVSGNRDAMLLIEELNINSGESIQRRYWLWTRPCAAIQRRGPGLGRIPDGHP